MPKYQEKNLDIAVVGLSCVDCIASGSGIQWNVMNPVQDLRLSAGGLGNALCTLSGLDLKVGVSSRIGSDIFGDFLRHYWDEIGVDTSGVVVDPCKKTGFSFILDHGTERTPFYSAGSNDAFCLDDIPGDFIEDSRCMLIFFAGALPSLDGTPMLELVKRCHDAGTAVIMDVSDGTGADYSSIISYLPYANLIINSEEARRITDEDTPLGALRRLDESWGENGMVRGVTRKSGVTLSVPSPEGRRHPDIMSPFFGLPVATVIGAGDAFRAGLAAYICLHYDDFRSGALDYRAAGLFASTVAYLHLGRIRDVRPFGVDDVDRLLRDVS